ncbi:unnamed protein product [Malus baccata var. baccata]
MKIQCDAYEKAPAKVICCADEAALCAKCDVEVHAANKLASKNQRLLLECLSKSNKLPTCDTCQDKAAFIFCVEDRALVCQDCDELIHSANSRSANHQRFLATGIRVALSTGCSNDTEPSSLEPPSSHSSHKIASTKIPTPQASDVICIFFHQKESFEFGELEWIADMGVFGEEQFPQKVMAAVAEVPKLLVPAKLNNPYKKPRIEMLEDDDDHFTVPDLG